MILYEKGGWNVSIAKNLYRCYRVWLRVRMGKQRRDKFLEDTHINMGHFLLFEKPIKAQGGIMGIPRKHTQDLYMLFWRYEKDIEPEILDLRQGESFLDVGANVGYYTLKVASASASHGLQIKIMSVEADPDNYKALCRNIQCNRFSNIIPINKAVWNSTGYHELRQRIVSTSSGNRISTDDATLCFEKPGMDDNCRILQVETDTIDNMVQENKIQNIGVLKIDVEGAEVRVLQGARETAKKTRKIVVEVHSENNMKEVRSILSSYGFSTRDVTVVRTYEYPFVIGEKRV
jgi:FkbM family methyltransferase